VDLFLAICEALGLGIAAGIGGPLAWLFIAVMAGAEAGIDPRGTGWEFVGATWFVAVLFAANVAAFAQRRAGLSLPLPHAAGAAVLGAIFGAAALAAAGEPAAIGLLIGAVAAGASSLLASGVMVGAERRTVEEGEGSPAATLALIFAAAGIVVAALALFVSPAALVIAAALAAFASTRRRRAAEKYEGLRVLR
jgi:hypothetical protein